MTLHRTRSDLSQDVRERTALALDPLLASAIDLSLQAKHAHWNVRGPSFRELHLLFDEVHAAAIEWQDLIAERIAQLGGTAVGELGSLAKRTKLPTFAPVRPDGATYSDALARAVAAFAGAARPAIDRVAEDEDAITADILTEVVRGADEKLWLIEAHLQAER